ncbi:MAG: YhdP family protein [Hydrogenophaga sp.]
MNPSPAPIAPATRTFKTLSVVTRLLLWLVLAAWALFALTWGALHLWIVPRIDQWRPDLERWATQAVGVPVRVSVLRARSGGGHRWLPDALPDLAATVELLEVSLLDEQGREALRLPRVQATLSPRSLWRRGFDQILLDAPVLEVRRTEQGRIEVAGLDLSGTAGGGSAAADWLFAQPVFVIRQGTLRWSDDRRGQAPLALSDLDLVVRNTGLSHAFRLDATPPGDWGQRLSLRGQLREPLVVWPRENADPLPWRHWRGELYADLPHADVARLRAYADLSDWGVDVQGGQGALRVWADVSDGRIAGITADLDLQAVDARLGPQLPPLAIQTVQGRLTADWGETGFGLATEDLSLRTREGQVWPGGHLSLRHSQARPGQPGSTVLAAERVDLAALAALAAHLPVSAEVHGWLQRLQPAGQLRALTASWQGPLSGASAYRAKGRVEGLALRGEDSGRRSDTGQHPVPGRPGIRGATVAFELDQAGGRAQVQVKDGALELPGVFEEPLLPLQRLETEAGWTVRGERIDVWLDRLSLANADAEGSGQVRWRTADPDNASTRSRFPGVLDLRATLTRADATRVHRYLPLSVDPSVRRYVREAVRAGRADRVDFRIQGDVWDVPFNAPGTRGEFRIAAALRGVAFDYVPAFLQDAGETPWPALQALDGELLLDRAALRVTGIQAGLAGAPGVRLAQGTIAIADLSHAATLEVRAQAQGPAGDMLGFVRRSPLNAMTGEALAQAQASGAARLQFDLNLPLHAVHSTTVQGTVQLPGNDLRMSPDAPLLGNASGRLGFSERGFTVRDGRARLYGGEVRFDGGLAPDARGVPRIQFRGQGTASADGLRDAGLGFVSRLFANASGSAPYSVQLGFRAGEPELRVSSNLQGMAFALPAPLGKAAAETLPLRFETRVLTTTSGVKGELPLTDRLRVDVGPPQQPLLALQYERNISGPEARVLRGSLAFGLGDLDAAPLPAAGVVANVSMPLIDADAWDKAFSAATGVRVLAPAGPSTVASLSYLPTHLALRTERLVLGGRSFHRVVLGATREAGGLWLANVEADELNGHVAYRPPAGSGSGTVQARLARLALASGAAQEVEKILQQPSSVPALDIVVDELVVAGRRLGRIEMEAVNRGEAPRPPEWRLTRLRLDAPEARLAATGNWAATASGAPRRTALGFTLDISDAGGWLARLGREGLVRGGKGRIEGNIGWIGSPLSLDLGSLSGQFKTDVERGQFLKVEPGAAKLLGVLSLQALPRRLVLDFRDVFSEGFAFDFVRGDARIEQGVVRTQNLQMKGVNAVVLMEGSADLARETQDLHVVVVPEINAGTAALLATAVNPAVGLGTFLAQLLLRAPLQSATTQSFHITGGWADPQVTKE